MNIETIGNSAEQMIVRNKILINALALTVEKCDLIMNGDKSEIVKIEINHLVFAIAKTAKQILDEAEHLVSNMI